MRFAVYIMVGPGEVEARRLRTLLASLFRHEPALPLLVLVNDSGVELSADGLIPGTCETVRLTSLPRAGARHTPNILQALRCLAGRNDWDFAFKLDTDALVIAPFGNKVGRFLADHPDVGQVGQAGTGCDGRPVDYAFFVRYARRLASRVQIWRSPGLGIAQAFFGPRARMRRLVLQAAANGLSGGRHCQGGAYAITRSAVQRLSDSGLLRADGTAAEVMTATDDLMLSTLVASTGFGIASLTGPGEPFAIQAAGLPMPPADLAGRGYALIHSVKNDARYREVEIVSFFEARDGVSRDQG